MRRKRGSGSTRKGVASDRPDNLNFSVLYERVEGYVKAADRNAPSAIERWSFWIGMLGAVFGLISANTLSGVLSSEAVIFLAASGLIVEMLGIGTSLVLMLIRGVPSIWNARARHAIEMDYEFDAFNGLVSWSKQFPASQRRARLRFVNSLRDGFTYRMGLVLGGVERLGILPVLIALYLQFKDWKWGDWDALAGVNLVGGLLIWAMVLLYGLGWRLVSLRVRLDTYAKVLEESLQPESPPTAAEACKV